MNMRKTVLRAEQRQALNEAIASLERFCEKTEEESELCPHEDARLDDARSLLDAVHSFRQDWGHVLLNASGD